MSTVLDRVPEVASAVLHALSTARRGLDIQQVAQAAGEEPYVTGLACRRLRHLGQITWDREPGSRTWLIRPAPPVTAEIRSEPAEPVIEFATFARDMGFKRGEVVVLQAVGVPA